MGDKSFFETSQLSLSSNSNTKFDIFDLPNLQSFETGYQSFFETTSSSLSSNSDMRFDNWIYLIYNHLVQDISHSINQQVCPYQVRIIE